MEINQVIIGRALLPPPHCYKGLCGRPYYVTVEADPL